MNEWNERMNECTSEWSDSKQASEPAPSMAYHVSKKCHLFNLP